MSSPTENEPPVPAPALDSTQSTPVVAARRETATQGTTAEDSAAETTVAQQTPSAASRLKSKLGEVWRKASEVWNYVAVWCGRDPRWYRAEDWRHETKTDLSRPSGGGFDVPARACPRGHMQEAAKAELISRSSILGQARLRAHFTFETHTCTVCGSRLIDRCGRCGARFVEPVKDRCRECGLPQPWSPDRLLSTTGVRARRWREDDSRDPAVLVRLVGDAGSLYVIEGDITSLAVDGVVSNDDVDGRMYTVIASAIKAAAGSDVERESLSQGPFKRGEAWLTDAGTLPAPIKAVVHVAAMDRRGDTDRDAIRRCVSSALEKARGMTSIGIAAFGTGPSGFGPKVIDIEAWLTDVGETVIQRLLCWQQAARAEADPEAEADTESSPSRPSAGSEPVATVNSGGEPEIQTAPPLDVVVVLYEPLNFEALVQCLSNAAYPDISEVPTEHGPVSLDYAITPSSAEA